MLSHNNLNKAPKQKLYAVKAGRTPGIYASWDEARAQTDGFPGAVFKSFATDADAAAFVSSPGRGYPSASSSGARASSGVSSRASSAGASYAPSVSSYAPSVSSYAPAASSYAYAPAPAPAPVPRPSVPSTPSLPGFISRAAVKDSGDKDSGDKDSPRTHIYTDGSCLGNGFHGAQAGYGVYFGPNDPRNVSAPLRGELQTNNRAELTAVISALEATSASSSSAAGPVTIHSDSMYVKNGVESWVAGWKQRGWTTSKGTPVLNQDLWVRLDSLLADRSDSVRLEWVRGHAGHPGNEAADRLANEGALKRAD